MSLFSSLLSLALPGLLLAGCAAEDRDATADAPLTAEDQKGIDVQVLQVWTPGRFMPRPSSGWFAATPGDVAIDAADESLCTTLRRVAGTTGYVSREVDCSGAVAEAAALDGVAAGPLMTPARFVVTERIADHTIFVDPDFCSRIELRVVVRDAAIARAAFAGIGFWSSRGETFTAKADLQEVGHVRLAQGDPATVYRFAGLSTCVSTAHGSTSGSMYQTFTFKPYAAYDGADGERFRVWEAIEGNHAIGRSWPGAVPVVDALGFDRQAQLLTAP